MYEVICDMGEIPAVLDGFIPSRYTILEANGRTEWKTKRTAQKHASEYKSIHLRDAWVQEV